MIEIIVNGTRKTVSKEMNVNGIIKELNYTQEGFALALNGTFVAIATYETTLIHDNDSIEILAPVQGG
ncbi:sulfur carrier protein ThiS [Sulfurovum sp.]|uniref:sulfur carrier protein ThiS n=1 Tax=Sulfurovum sp. TaxID=1969726 RepID=UPI00286825AD|nr:sulfur carrier protein ThiS [Sulfurovum sp.]